MHINSFKNLRRKRRNVKGVFYSALGDKNLLSKKASANRLKNKITFVARNKNRLFRVKKLFKQVKKENKKIPQLLNKRTKILRVLKRKIKNKRLTKDIPMAFINKYTPSYIPPTTKQNFLTSSPVKNVEKALINTKKANAKVLFEAKQKEKRLKTKINNMEKTIKNVERTLSPKEKDLSKRLTEIEAFKEKAKEREKIINETSPIVAPIENMRVERKIDKENKILETMAEDEPEKTNKIPLIAATVVASILLLKGA